METDPTRRGLIARAPWLLAAGALPGCAFGPPAGGPGGGASRDGPLRAERTRAPAPPEIAIARDDAPVPDALRRLVAGPRRFDFLLLGEVHDHPLHHRLRAQWLSRLARVGSFAIALEQLDAVRQDDLDRARAAGLGAEDLARAAGFDFRGWTWEAYAPLVALALGERLGLVAANLSTAQTRAIARGSARPAADIVPPTWGDAERAAMSRVIANGHCGLLPERAVAAMVTAQLARDATIADAIVRSRARAGLPVVLIAGNGHVRRDIGVARHLAARAPGARVFCVGFLETGHLASGPDGTPRYDLVVRTPEHPRADPCEKLRRTMPPARTG